MNAPQLPVDQSAGQPGQPASPGAVASSGSSGAALDVIAALQPYRSAGVLSAGDVHGAAVLLRLTGCTEPDVALAVALAARAPRYGHICVDLAQAATSVLADLEAGPTEVVVAEVGRSADGAASGHALAWPEPSTWVDTVAASAVVAGPNAALVLDGSLLYSQRYHRYERTVADHLIRLAGVPVEMYSPDDPAYLHLLSGAGAEQQRSAVEAAMHSGLTVLVGGPGTGKTTTVAALLATLAQQGTSLRVALAAPTGKAAARLTQSFRAAATKLPDPLASELAAIEAVTIHRLLGSIGGSGSRFHHDRHRRLPFDVLIIDETSMVSLPMMAKLLDAVSDQARVVLVGDPAQLASVEAGSVLADIAGPAIEATRTGPALTGPLASSVSVLSYSHRFPPGSPIDRFAQAVRAGDSTTALAVLADPVSGSAAVGAIAWFDRSADNPQVIAAVRAMVLDDITAIAERAVAGDAAGALDVLERVRVLCAHREGPHGVGRWNARLEDWLAETGASISGWYPGRPVMITANDYRLGLFNGDVGVVVNPANPASSVPSGSRVMVAFPGGDAPELIAPSRIDRFETVHAMTIHKSQGSEFDHVVVVVPPVGSRLATRELLYTAVTRARSRVTLIGEAAALVEAIGRGVDRSSGLTASLWPGLGAVGDPSMAHEAPPTVR